MKVHVHNSSQRRNNSAVAPAKVVTFQTAAEAAREIFLISINEAAENMYKAFKGDMIFKSAGRNEDELKIRVSNMMHPDNFIQVPGVAIPHPYCLITKETQDIFREYKPYVLNIFASIARSSPEPVSTLNPNAAPFVPKNPSPQSNSGHTNRLKPRLIIDTNTSEETHFVLREALKNVKLDPSQNRGRLQDQKHFFR
jgi:hypothetical protein